MRRPPGRDHCVMASTALVPRQLIDVDLSAPLKAVLPAQDRNGVPYAAADVLVRMNKRPLGLIRLNLPPAGIAPAELAQAIESNLAGVIADHRAANATPVSAETSLPTPSVSVVIPTRGRPHLLLRCVDAILAGVTLPLEIIVVDNAPSDDTLAKAVTARYNDRPEVRYLVEPIAGTSRARNAGAGAARGELIAFIDDDAVADSWWVTNLAREAADTKAACITGLVLPLSLDSQAELMFEEAAGFGRGFTRRVYATTKRPAPTLLFPYTAGQCGSSNNMAVRRSVLDALGGFDVRLGGGTRPRGGEDLDLLTRILLADHEIIYQPAAMVRHEHRADATAVRRQLFSYGTGATAVLSKWAVRDPGLRRQLAKTAMSLFKEIVTLNDPRSNTASVSDRPASRGKRAASRAPGRRTSVSVFAGFVCGPWLYWRESVTRK